MALIRCSECGKDFSDNAKTCPQCGYPLQVEVSNDQLDSSNSKEKTIERCNGFGCRTILLIVLAIPIIFIILIALSYSSESFNDQVVNYEKTTISQMRNDLEKNEIRALNAYKGRWFEISGILGNMDSNGTYFFLEEKSAFFNTPVLRCEIIDEKKSWLSNVLMTKQKGDTITIKGKVSGVDKVAETVLGKVIMGYDVMVIDIE